MKSNARGSCDCDSLVSFLLVSCFSRSMFRLGVGVFIGACEINISSCHLNCVMLWLYTILFLHNTLNTFRISIAVVVVAAVFFHHFFPSFLLSFGAGERKEDRRN